VVVLDSMPGIGEHVARTIVSERLSENFLCLYAASLR
jgi:hypothetical protein